MNHLFSCLKRYRIEAILAPLFKLFEAAMELVVPLVIASIVDVGVKNADKMYIVHAVLLLAAFAVFGLAFALTAQYFAAKAAVGAGAELRGRLFSKLQSFSFAQIDEMGTATMLTRMTSDVNQVQTGVNMMLRIFLRSPIVVFGATAFAFFIDWRAGVVFISLIPLLFAVIYLVMAVTIPRYKKVQEKLDGVYLSTRENLSGVRVIRAFRLEDEERRRFAEKSDTLAKTQIGVGRVAALTAPLTFLLVNIAIIVLVAVGAVRIDVGGILQGDLLALYIYLSLILTELVKCANLIVTTAKSVSCMRRIGSVLDQTGEEDAVASPEAPVSDEAISFENVSFTYAGGAAPALHGITFSARRGEVVGILGGTGAGKSTLVRLLPRFYEATEGTVRLGGQDVKTIPFKELRSRIGYVPQKAVLFRGTIAENVRWGRENASDEEVEAALGVAQAEDVAASKGGIHAEVMQAGRNFSGGQRQRLTVARAILRSGEVLILDDSASALDYATDARLNAAVKELGCTTLIVSQRVASVMHADKILVLEEGRIAGMGTHESLLADCPLYREIYRSQTEDV